MLVVTFVKWVVVNKEGVVYTAAVVGGEETRSSKLRGHWSLALGVGADKVP
jgi:hypothetical protein